MASNTIKSTCSISVPKRVNRRRSLRHQMLSCLPRCLLGCLVPRMLCGYALPTELKLTGLDLPSWAANDPSDSPVHPGIYQAGFRTTAEL